MSGQPPFDLGQLVICTKQRLPDMVALPVFDIVPQPWGWTIGAGRPGAAVYAPAEEFIAAPVDWQDPPTWPNGSAAHGQGEAHWQAKLAFDDADPAHQERMVEFHAAMLRWLTRFGMRINRAEAAGLSEAHRDFLRDASTRLRELRAPAGEMEAA